MPERLWLELMGETDTAPRRDPRGGGAEGPGEGEIDDTEERDAEDCGETGNIATTGGES